MSVVKTFLVVMVVSTQPGGQSYVKTFEQPDNPAGLYETKQDCWVQALLKKRDYEAKVTGTNYRVRTHCYTKVVDR